MCLVALSSTSQNNGISILIENISFISLYFTINHKVALSSHENQKLVSSIINLITKHIKQCWKSVYDLEKTCFV